MENRVNPADAVSPNSKPKKSKTALWWVLIAVALMACGALGYYYIQYKNKEKEEVAFSLLENNEKLADYEDFLRLFPTGEHSTEVKERLQNLKKMYEDWEVVKRSSSTADFNNFKQRYPKSVLVKQADLKIDSLDWKTVSQLNTTEAYEEYISRHPDGRYIADATTALGHIRDTTVGQEEAMMITENLRNFFQAFGNREEAVLCTYIAPKMSQFLSKRNATKADVVELINKMFNENISSCNFVVNNDLKITKSTDDNGNVSFQAKGSLDQHIERTNPGKTFGSYTLQANFNDQYIITSLTLNEVSRSESNEDHSSVIDRVKNLLRT